MMIPLECGECGGTYREAGNVYARCTRCGKTVEESDFDMDAGETLTFDRDGVLGYIPDHDCEAVDTPDGGIWCQVCATPAVQVPYYGWKHERGEAHADAVEDAGLDSTLRAVGVGRPYTWGEVAQAFTRRIRGL